MGCGCSSQTLEPIATTIDAGGGDLFKASRLYAPLSIDATKSYEALVTVHGLCEEKNGILRADWTYMQHLSEHLAQDLGIVVLMIGMPDDDDRLLKEHPETATLKHRATAGIVNTWPAKYTSAALNAAIDHLIAITPDKLGVQIDPERIGIVGHSLGGGGALYAGAAHCRERVKAIVALNPSHAMVEKPYDNYDLCVQYGKGANFSGESGEGAISHLAQITAPTLILASQAEYNTTVTGEPMSPVWPTPECVFEQVGAAKKELYVDNITDQTWLDAHLWMRFNPGIDAGKRLKTYADGMFYKLIASFVRRHVSGSAEALLERPGKTKAWEQIT